MARRAVLRVAAGVIALGAAAVLFSRPPALPPTSFHPFCQAAAVAHCEKRVQCGASDPRQLAACVQEIGADCDQTLGWRLKLKVASLEPKAAAECVEGLTESGCNALQFVFGDDEMNIFEGTTECELAEMLRLDAGIGSACALAVDCPQGFCPFQESSCHFCRPFVARGAICAKGVAECDPARDFCDGPPGNAHCAPLVPAGSACTAWYQCADQVCRTEADAGASQVCGALPSGAPCRSRLDCGGGAFCRGLPGPATCAPRARTGDPCSHQAGEDGCAESEARCVQGHCRVRPYVLAAGEPCRDFADCKEGLYCKGARGEAAGVCAAKAKHGEPCLPLDYGACPVDSRCVSNTCQPLVSEGKPCRGLYQCRLHVACVPEALEKGFSGGATCRPYATVGERCNPFLPCAEAFCALDADGGTSGTCSARLPGGAPCQAAEDCASGSCDLLPDAGGNRCRARCFP